jgi:outer membrane protein
MILLRRVRVTAVAVAAFGTLAPAAARAQAAAPAAPTRLAFVNIEQVMKTMPEYIQAESTLTREMRGFQAEVEKLQRGYDSTVRVFEQQTVVLSPSARQTKQREIQEMGQRIQQRVNEVQTKVQQRERDLVEPIEQRVQGVIEGIRAERNYAIIFNVSTPGNAIVTADKSLDITAIVMQRLRSAASP